MVDTLILDLDDTLCDYRGIELMAQAAVGDLMGLSSEASDSFWRAFSENSHTLYRSMARGEITLQQFRHGRFARTLEGYPGFMSARNVEDLNRIFMEITNGQIRLFPDTLPFLKALRKMDIRAILYTNGPDETQRAKAQRLGLDGLVEAFHTSGETRLYKPDAAVYRFLMERYSFSSENALNVGDSPQLDVPGAANMGIRTVLVKRDGTAARGPWIHASSLMEIIESGILGRKGLDHAG